MMGMEAAVLHLHLTRPTQMILSHNVQDSPDRTAKQPARHSCNEPIYNREVTFTVL